MAKMQLGKLLGIIGIILISVFLLVAIRNYFSNSQITNNIVKEVDAGAKNNGEEQIVDLSVKNYNYYPNTINLKYNVPAKIVVDTNKVRGCLQSIVIPDFGVRKFVTAKDNIISFVPDKKGTFSFSCSMGMGFGKIVVS
ncbi:cupredoxin domain-containing protein [Candidatus Woesearchaeota archaeon]|nr:cupredoxin domain-containing protein [Candidatus Woesearchaeota archaeon]